MIYHLVWRNLWRNKRRTLITTASVTFAVFLAITMGCLQRGVFDNMIRNMVNYYSGYIQLHKAGYWEERMIDNSFQLNDNIIQLLNGKYTVQCFVPRIETFMLASAKDQTRGIYLCGTDPAKERIMTEMDQRIVKGSWLKDKSDNGVIIAQGLSRRLMLDAGDTIVLLGQGMYGSMAAGKFPVKGVFRLGSPDLNDVLVLMDLKLAQDLLSAPGMATAIAIRPDREDNLEEAVQKLSIRIGSGYEVMSWKTMMPEVYNHIRIDNNSLFVMTVFLYLIIAFGMFGTVLMMINERRYEFGMLVAIGMKKIRLAKIITSELVLLAFIGAFAGMLLSWPVVLYLQEFPLRLSGSMGKAFIDYGFEPIFPARLNMQVFIQQAASVLVLCVMMSIYPVMKIWKMNPLNQIKR